MRKYHDDDTHGYEDESEYAQLNRLSHLFRRRGNAHRGELSRIVRRYKVCQTHQGKSCKDLRLTATLPPVLVLTAG